MAFVSRISRSVQVNLREPWWIGPVRVPSRIVLAQDDADRESLLERDAPAPARLTARDPHLSRRLVPADALEVGEVRDVLPGPEARRNSERAGREARAPGGVDDEIGRLSAEPRRRGDGLGTELQLCARTGRGIRHELRARGHVVDARGDRLGEQRVVELRSRNVVGVRKHGGREAVEGDAHAVRRRPDERDAGLDAAEARRFLFQVEPSEDRDHRRNQRLTDEQLGTAPVVDERHGGADDRDPHASRSADAAGFQFGALHPIPSRMTSTILAASTSVTTPSIQDTTRLLRPPQRLKNTPIPGRGGTTGTW